MDETTCGFYDSLRREDIFQVFTGRFNWSLLNGSKFQKAMVKGKKNDLLKLWWFLNMGEFLHMLAENRFLLLYLPILIYISLISIYIRATQTSVPSKWFFFLSWEWKYEMLTSWHWTYYLYWTKACQTNRQKNLVDISGTICIQVIPESFSFFEASSVQLLILMNFHPLLQEKVLACFACIAHIVMIWRFTALMRVECRYSFAKTILWTFWQVFCFSMQSNGLTWLDSIFHVVTYNIYVSRCLQPHLQRVCLIWKGN